jgi:ribose transport system ATP-binding protein
VGTNRVAPALEAREISKRFGGARALASVAITVERGEVHGLVGANGSGKSTLVKVLAGYHAPAPGGRLTVGGRRARLPLRPGDARALGLRFVHQELGLISSLSVVENVRLDELSAARWRWISWRREREQARATLARLWVDVDLRARVEELSPLERALLAIARAARETPAVLVLDEPTGFLPRAERERLHDLVRRVARAGSGVLLVSHELAEVRKLAGRVTVLRDGRAVATVDASVVDDRELAALVSGAAQPNRPVSARGSPIGGVFSVAGLCGRILRDVSLELRRGEVVGLTGLASSGFDELPYLLFGARRAHAGRLTLDGEHDLTTMTPARAVRVGIGLLPAAREREGAAGALPIADNVLLPMLRRYAGAFGLGLDRRRLMADAAGLLLEHDVMPGDPRAPFGTLSGGNQQKALVAKWLGTHPVLLMLDEPLRGVDVRSRGELIQRIRAVAARGAAVVCASAEREQLSELCDRVLVFSNGRVVCSPSA